MQRTLKQSLIFIVLLIYQISLLAQAPRSVGTEIFGTFEHIPRDPTALITDGPTGPGGGGGPTGPVGAAPVPGAYRSIDGTSNNLSFPEWGATDIVFQRELAAAYGTPDRLNSLAGTNRKSARAISNLLNKQGSALPSRNNLSSFVFTWGQFIDHDIDLSGEARTESVPILLPADEPTFTLPIPFHRSEVFPGTGINTPREQVNLITSWIDASNVYGSERRRANWLRTYSFGKLKTSAGNLLPYNTTNGEKNGAIDPIAPSMASVPGAAPNQFVAGDVRANEQPGLTTLHTLFVREHNRYCDELIALGLTDDEEIYQTARKWIGGLLQHITFTEFLPAMGIFLDGYPGYQSSVQPDILNIFANAAYRIGHTMVTEELLVLDAQCTGVNANTSLAGNFFNNSLIENYGLEPIFRGLSSQVQEEIDLGVVDGLRDFLFNIPGAPPAGLDLASLNIQRGRDHGLPDYNSLRQRFLGQRASSFADITSDTDLQYRLGLAYDGDINNIDPWVGLLAEDHQSGAAVGPTMRAILKTQFQRLRDGDYYYYENDPLLPSSVMQQIRSTTLADVIKRNTTLDVPNAIFQAKDCNGGNNGSLCDQVTFSENNGDLVIGNLAAPFKNIKVYQLNQSGGYTGAAVYECVGSCSATIRVPLPIGSYAIHLSLYDASWSPICGENVYMVELTGSGGTSGGGTTGTTGGGTTGTTGGGTTGTTGGGTTGTTSGGTTGGTTGGGSLCDQVTFVENNGGLSINNLSAPFKNIKVYQLNQSGGYNSPAAYECVGSCNTSITIPNLSIGSYAVFLSLFDENWSPICGENTYTINLTGSGGTTGGGTTGGGTTGGGTTGGSTTSGGNGSACDQVTFSGSNGTLTIDKLSTPFQNIKVFQINQYGGYNTPAVYECVGSCSATVNIPNLSNGRYLISLVLFDSNWSPICGENTYEVTLASSYASATDRSSEVLNLSAVPREQQVQLAWASNHTYKGDHFIIERAADGKDFVPISTHAITEKSFEIETFRDIDTQPLEGENYYRIQLVDVNGASKYTDVQKAIVPTIPAFGIFPNPTATVAFLNLSTYKGEVVDLKIHDHLGHLVYEQLLPAVREDYQRIETVNYSNGIYFVTMRVKGQALVSKKLIVKRLY